jgi:hypothetical protein
MNWVNRRRFLLSCAALFGIAALPLEGRGAGDDEIFVQTAETLSPVLLGYQKVDQRDCVRHEPCFTPSSAFPLSIKWLTPFWEQ